MQIHAEQAAVGTKRPHSDAVGNCSAAQRQRFDLQGGYGYATRHSQSLGSTTYSSTSDGNCTAESLDGIDFSSSATEKLSIHTPNPCDYKRPVKLQTCYEQQLVGALRAAVANSSWTVTETLQSNGELRYTAWRRCLGGGVAVAVEHVNMAGLLGWGAREFGLEDPFLG